jgi:hypothetical protein
MRPIALNLKVVELILEDAWRASAQNQFRQR